MMSTLDISSVTDRLIAHLDNSVNVWPRMIDNGGTINRFGINVSGQMPETECGTRTNAGSLSICST